jgi:hypothetical protein
MKRRITCKRICGWTEGCMNEDRLINKDMWSDESIIYEFGNNKIER